MKGQQLRLLQTRGVVKMSPMTSDLVYRVMFCLVLLTLDAVAGAERFFFLNNGQVRQGCVYKPAGDGPFPTVVFNQPIVRPLPGDGPVNPFPELGKFYTSRNYVLFVPGRHTTTTLPPNDLDLEERERVMIKGHETEVEVLLSAITALKAQSYVDARRILVTGYSSGATTTLLLAEKELDVCGFVVFSPAAQIWKDRPLMRSTLHRAVNNATAPVFLIQPQNDQGLGPIEALGKELVKKGAPNRSKVFPPYGKDPKEGSYFAISAPQVWGPDVISFFEEVAK